MKKSRDYRQEKLEALAKYNENRKAEYMKTFPTTYEITNKAQIARALLEPLSTTRIGNYFVFNVQSINRVDGEDNRFRVVGYDVCDEKEITLYVEVVDA